MIGIFEPKKDTIDVRVGENILVRAEVSSNTNLMDFQFTWYTCRNMSEIVTLGAGVLEMPYEALSTTGPDCIRVKIEKEKGGGLEDDSYVFVNVNE